MEEVLRELLGIKSVNLRTQKVASSSHGFKCLGIAASIPGLEIHSDEVFIWHVRAGILPLTKSEMIRFGIDAPSGLNLILSEREVLSECHSVQNFDYKILEPDDISLWVGKAVLSGDLIASAKSDNGDEKRIMDTQRNEIQVEGTLVLKPTIEIKNWSTQRGMDGFTSTPIILAARLWMVSGDLQGPNGEREPGEWNILEDPWSKTVTLLNGIHNLQQAPVLRMIEPQNLKWLTSDRINEELAKVIEERRRNNVGEDGFSGSVRSMLLQKWSLDSETANISDRKILIPGWVIHLETEKILHGRNGRLYDY